MVGGGIGGGGGDSGDEGVGVGGRPRAGNCPKVASLRLARPIKLPGTTPIKLLGTGRGEVGGDGPATLGTRADGASWWRAGRLDIIYNT